MWLPGGECEEVSIAHSSPSSPVSFTQHERTSIPGFIGRLFADGEWLDRWNRFYRPAQDPTARPPAEDKAGPLPPGDFTANAALVATVRAFRAEYDVAAMPNADTDDHVASLHWLAEANWTAPSNRPVDQLAVEAAVQSAPADGMVTHSKNCCPFAMRLPGIPHCSQYSGRFHRASRNTCLQVLEFGVFEGTTIRDLSLHMLERHEASLAALAASNSSGGPAAGGEPPPRLAPKAFLTGQIHGFDSFEGLPHDWAGRPGMSRGHFDLGGAHKAHNNARDARFLLGPFRCLHLVSVITAQR